MRIRSSWPMLCRKNYDFPTKQRSQKADHSRQRLKSMEVMSKIWGILYPRSFTVTLIFLTPAHRNLPANLKNRGFLLPGSFPKTSIFTSYYNASKIWFMFLILWKSIPNSAKSWHVQWFLDIKTGGTQIKNRCTRSSHIVHTAIYGWTQTKRI